MYDYNRRNLQLVNHYSINQEADSELILPGAH